MLSVHLRQFTWSSQRKVAAAEASTLQWRGQELIALTTWTGEVIVYTLDEIVMSADGEIQGWTFKPPSDVGCDLLIFND